MGAEGKYDLKLASDGEPSSTAAKPATPTGNLYKLIIFVYLSMKLIWFANKYLCSFNIVWNYCYKHYKHLNNNVCYL